jgi:hypothetical protein
MIVAGLTQAQGAVLRFSVSLIMCAGGEYCGIRHDRNVSSASIVPELTDVLRRNAGVGLGATVFDLQPAVAAVETLCDLGGGLRRPAEC